MQLISKLVLFILAVLVAAGQPKPQTITETYEIAIRAGTGTLEGDMKRILAFHGQFEKLHEVIEQKIISFEKRSVPPGHFEKIILTTDLNKLWEIYENERDSMIEFHKHATTVLSKIELIEKTAKEQEKPELQKMGLTFVQVLEEMGKAIPPIQSIQEKLKLRDRALKYTKKE